MNTRFKTYRLVQQNNRYLSRGNRYLSQRGGATSNITSYTKDGEAGQITLEGCEKLNIPKWTNTVFTELYAKHKDDNEFYLGKKEGGTHVKDAKLVTKWVEVDGVIEVHKCKPKDTGADAVVVVAAQEKARLAQEKADKAKADKEKAKADKARLEQARLEQARLEQARLEQAEADKKKRADEEAREAVRKQKIKVANQINTGILEKLESALLDISQYGDSSRYTNWNRTIEDSNIESLDDVDGSKTAEVTVKIRKLFSTARKQIANLDILNEMVDEGNISEMGNKYNKIKKISRIEDAGDYNNLTPIITKMNKVVTVQGKDIPNSILTLVNNKISDDIAKFRDRLQLAKDMPNINDSEGALRKLVGEIDSYNKDVHDHEDIAKNRAGGDETGQTVVYNEWNNTLPALRNDVEAARQAAVAAKALEDKVTAFEVAVDAKEGSDLDDIVVENDSSLGNTAGELALKKKISEIVEKLGLKKKAAAEAARKAAVENPDKALRLKVRHYTLDITDEYANAVVDRPLGLSGYSDAILDLKRVFNKKKPKKEVDKYHDKYVRKTGVFSLLNILLSGGDEGKEDVYDRINMSLKLTIKKSEDDGEMKAGAGREMEVKHMYLWVPGMSPYADSLLGKPLNNELTQYSWMFPSNYDYAADNDTNLLTVWFGPKDNFRKDGKHKVSTPVIFEIDDSLKIIKIHLNTKRITVGSMKLKGDNPKIIDLQPEEEHLRYDEVHVGSEFEI